MNEIAVTEQVMQQLAASRGEGERVLADLKAFAIQSPEDCQVVADTWNEARARAKAVTDLRMPITRAIDHSKEMVMGLFRPAFDAWKAIENEGRAKQQAWEQSVLAKRRAAEAELMAAASAAASASETSPSEPVRGIRDLVVATITAMAPAGTRVTSTWEAVVQDIGALIEAVAAGKAPANLLRVDESALRIYARETQGTKPIAGVMFKEVASVAATAARKNKEV